MQQPPQGLFHNARPIDDIWLDERGEEYRLPTTVIEDQNWASQRARDFWRNADAGRSSGASSDNFWSSLLDDNDEENSLSGPDECDEECEMPGLSVSGSQADEYSPYPSKTVCHIPLVTKEN